MAKMSPAVARTVAVLNFFADHPRQAFTLTEIVRALKLSRATCHALLAALVDSNYLFRTSDKSYRLGPALARVANVARDHLDPLQAAAGEMRNLADELDVICSAVFQDNGVAMVRERATSRSHIGWVGHLGRQFPIHPPFGSIFLAWSKQPEIERWITAMPAEPGLSERSYIDEGLAFARTHGFTFGIRKEHIVDEAHAQSLLYRLDKTDYLVGALNAGERYELAFVTAPVFDAEGRVLFALALTGFVSAMAGSDVEQIGHRLRQSCDRITHFIGGLLPA